MVLVEQTPNELRAVNDYLKATQLVVERRVMLEAKIIEVSLFDSYQSGINWSQFAGAANKGCFERNVARATLANTGAMLASAVSGNGASGVSVDQVLVVELSLQMSEMAFWFVVSIE